MQLVPGQVVVHPQHGPARVVGHLERELGGRTVRYVRLEVEDSTLVIAVPVDSVEEVGVRAPMAPAELDELFAVLTAASPRAEKQWSRRIKDQVERFRSGQILVVAGVVRDLLRRNAQDGLSMGERELLRDARRPLVAELTGCLRTTESHAEQVLEAAVLEGVVPPVPLQLAPAV